MRDNGLTATSYTSMGGIDPQVAEPVLKALAEAGIAAYCSQPSTPEPASGKSASEAAAEAVTASGKSTSEAAAEAVTASGKSASEAATETVTASGKTQPADGAAEAADASSSSQPSGAEGAAKADPAGTSEPSSPPRPSGAEGAAKAEPAAEGATPAKSDNVAGASSSPTTPSGAEGVAKAEVSARVPVGFEEIFVAAESEVRARGVIARSTEDAEWASLVEQFNAPSAEGHDATPVPRWPASEDVDEGSYEPLIDVPAGLIVGDTDEDPPEEPPARRREDHHEHFVPPEPPRGPKLDWISRAAWLGLIGGPLLLILAALLDFGTGRTTTIAVVGFVGGFLTLVIRMKDRLPPEDTPDDGAVV